MIKLVVSLILALAGLTLSAPGTAEASHEQITPAPTTVKGFQSMWDEVSPVVWGGGDVSLSVAMTDTRSVWLFGDTLSERNGFVHSSAVVQDGGTLHVSDKGEQLLPNGKRGEFYWIEQAKRVDFKTLHVTAAPMYSGGNGSWNFRRALLRSRVAEVTVSNDANLSFVKWVKYVKAPKQYSDLTGNESHWTYETRAHKEFTLSGGKTLMTRNNNWAKLQSDLTKYRPTFFAGDGTEDRDRVVDSSYL